MVCFFCLQSVTGFLFNFTFYLSKPGPKSRIRYGVNFYSDMVLGDKHYKHTDEGPCRSSRRTRSPSAAVLANATAAATSSGTMSIDDADGMFAVDVH